MIEVKGLYKDWKEFSLKKITLEIKKGEYFVILGPTGAGKTLLLETIAGFYIPDKGEVRIDGHEVTELPPEKRNIGFIYQDYSLFPHLTVEENIVFGLKLKKSSSPDTNRKRVKEIMDRLSISHLAHRYPSTLSGGEQQRVAIARAIAIEPAILLLDEPLSALDPRTRDYLREELKRVREELGITMVHVTHDQTEALILADRIAVMMHGRIAQVGTPYEIFNKPLTDEIADFVGVENIVRGVVRSNEQGIAEIEVDTGTIFAVSEYPAGEVKVCIRPEDIILSESRGESSARNVMRGRIKELHDMGPLTRVKMDTGLVALITKQSRENLGLQKGDEVYATFKATAVHVVR
ncbi:MAG: ABC transporter ATP-binding protein [Methanophagales archaeon]|nr:ABC transporter ATP-binding protein [Methanophagales archaeon]